MSCSNSCAHYGEMAKDAVVPTARKIVTIRETLDRRIEAARKHVEDLCITKAKLEALNVLDHDVDLYREVMF